MSEGSMGKPPDTTYPLWIKRHCGWLQHRRCTIWRFEFVFEECVDMEENIIGMQLCNITSNALLDSRTLEYFTLSAR